MRKLMVDLDEDEVHELENRIVQIKDEINWRRRCAEENKEAAENYRRMQAESLNNG